jgi:hypothetical protein
MNRLLSLACLAAALCVPALATSNVKSEYRKLSPDALAHMQKQRQFVADLVRQHFPAEKITRSRADFALLQKIVDSGILKKDETWKLQSLGIVFGDALAATIEGLAWWEVTDEYGTDPTLRYRATTLQYNALTIISKRVEEGREIHLEDMAAWLADYIRTKGPEYEN